MSRKFSRRQFIKISAIGIAAAGAVVSTGKIALESSRGEFPNPYPVMPDRKPVIPSPTKKPLFFNNHQYSLVAALAALIVPTDDYPGATEAGVTDYIDRMVAESEKYQKQYVKGLDWIEYVSQRQYGKNFLNLTVNEQIEMLVMVNEEELKISRSVSGLIDRIYRKAYATLSDLFGIGDSLGFFKRIRNDAFYGYYSSPVSWKVVGYYGPPQPVGYPDYSEPPSSDNYIDTIRPINNNICQNCHFDLVEKDGHPVEKVSHKDYMSCMNCHEPHSPIREYSKHD